MCHNSGIEKGEQQIERYMAFGLPSRAVKSVKYTMRKREKQQQKKEQQQLRQKHHQQEQYLEELELSSSSNSSNNYSDSEDSGTDSTSMQLASAEAAKMVETKPEAESEPEATEPETAETVTSSAAAVAVTTAENLTLTETHSPKDSSMENSSSNNNSEIFKIPKMCGRFRKLQQQQQQPQQQVEDISQLKAEQQRKLSSMEPSMDDALAIGTQMTRKVSDRIACLVAQLQESRLYTILTRTTQPAHLIAVCILAFVLMTVGRDLIEGSPATTPTTTTTTTRTLSSSSSPARGGEGGGGGTLPNLVYLGAFATHFGSQIWMTFVSGLSLYFSLPRHIFGQCQQILFPRYFAFNAMLSLTMLVTYAKYFLSGWTTASGIQVGSLALAAGIEVVVRLYLVPPMLKLMHEKYKIEGAIGSGQEVGSLVQGDLIDCPHYQRIHKGFRRIHMTIAIGNMTVMLSTCLQLYFLASKIHLS